MKRTIHVGFTILFMLIISRFIIRIVDATVQIDGDIELLLLLLIIVNVCIGYLSYIFYRRFRINR